MNREDLPLLGFTLLIQLALGAVFAAAMLPLRVAGAADPEPLVRQLLYAAAAASMIGLLLSLSHLGRPLAALRAIINLKSSWLSREVLFTGLFAGLTCVAALLAGLGLGGANLLWLVALTGFAAVFTMARLYQATVRPAWTSWYTPLSFLITAVVLGVAAAAPLVRFALPEDALVKLLVTDMLLTGAGALAILVVAFPLYWSATEGLSRRGAAITAVRFALAAGGMGLLVYGQQSLAFWALGVGAVALAAGEVMGRVLFFSH